MKTSKFLNLFIFFISFCLIIYYGKANGQNCTINTNVNGIGGTATASHNIGQSFTACGTGVLNTIRVTVTNTTAATAYCNIYAGEGTGGTLLGTSAQISVSLNGTNTWNVRSLNIDVVAGQKYTAVFYSYSGTANFQYGTYPLADYYPGGRIINYGASNNDMFFTATIVGIPSPTRLPAHLATTITRNTPIQLQFDRDMMAGTGTITLKNVANSETQSFLAEDLIIEGSLVTIPNTEILEMNTQYEVVIPLGALKSTDGIKFGGYSAGQWTFTTSSNSVVQLVSSAGYRTNLSQIAFNANFSESVTGFESDDVDVINGTLSDFSGSNALYSFNISPTAEGPVTVKILPNVINEGNDATEYIIEYDLTPPSVQISSNSEGVTVRMPLLVSIEFSEAVKDFEFADLTISNADSSGFVNLGDTLFLVSLLAADEGKITIDLDVDKLTDIAGNGNLAANQFSIDYEIDLEDGLISYYAFNGDARDITGNNSTLLLYYGQTPPIVEDHHQQQNGAYQFNFGILRIPDFDNSPSGQGFSVSTWMMPLSAMNSSSTRRVIYDHRGTTSILFYEAGELKLTLNNPSSTFSLTHDFNLEQWYHIVVTVVPNGKVKFFIDNVEYVVGDAPASLDQRAQSFFVGGTTYAPTNQGIDYLQANVDELRFYGKALNPLEVDSLFSYPVLAFANKIEAICLGDTLFRGGKTFTTAGIYTYIEEGFSNLDTLVTLTLSINQRPLVSASANHLTVCEGTEVILTGNGASSYLWDNDVVDGVVFSPSETKTYTVIGTDVNGCRDTAQIAIEVVENEIIDVSPVAAETNFCGQTDVSTTISIDNTIVGYNYYLRNDEDDSIVDGPLAGNGGSIVFNTNTISATTTYNVYAESIAGPTTGLDFDGVNDKVVIPYDVTMDVTSQFTIETWVYPRSANYDRLIGNYSGTGNTPGDIVIDTYTPANNGRGLRLYMTKANSTAANIFVDNVLTLNQWNHVAAVFDNGTMKLFANGIEVSSGSFGATTIPNNTANWVIGEDNGGTVPEFLNGVIDEVRFWKIARSSEEIYNSLSSCLSGTEYGLTAYYRFDDGSGTTLSDLTANENHGTLVDMNGATDWVTGYLSCSTVCSLEMSETVTIYVDLPEIVASEDDTISLGESIEISATGGVSYTWDNGLGEGQSHTVSPTETTTYIVTGSNGTCSGTDSVTITVIALPVITQPIGNQTVNEDEFSPLTIDLNTVFNEPFGADLFFSVISDNESVSVSIQESVLTISAPDNYFGIANISVTAENENGSATDDFELSILPVNDKPVLSLSRDLVEVFKNFQSTEIVSVSTEQPENESDQNLSFTMIPNSVSFANVSLQNNGEIVITSISESFGSQEFMIIVDDGETENNADTATFVLHVLEIPMPIVSNPINDQEFDEDMVDFTIADLNTVFTHPSGTALSFSSNSNSDFISSAVDGNSLLITVSKDYFGAATIEVTASDGVYSATDEFDVLVRPVNDAPEFTLSQTSVVLGINFEGAKQISVTDNSPENESDQVITYSLDPEGVSFANVTINPATGKVEISQIVNQSGSQVFTVIANDGQLEFNTYSQTFELSVLANMPPSVVNPISDIEVDEDSGETAVIQDVSSVFDDSEGDALNFTVLSSNESVLAKLNANTLVIEPVANYFGNAEITLRADDGNSHTDDVFNVTVVSVNDTPEFELSESLITVGVNFEASISIASTLLNTPENEIDQIITFSLSPASVPFANISINEVDGKITITAIENQVGSQVFTVTANDGQEENNISTQTFELHVVNANPTNIFLSNTIIVENGDVSAYIGELSSEDADFVNFTYSLVSGEGSSDNSNFMIEGSSLVAKISFNFESKQVHFVRIKTDDGLGGYFEKYFQINVVDNNDSPTDLMLSNNQIEEDETSGTLIGLLSVNDEDQGDYLSDHTYSLVMGEGGDDADNSNFIIDDNMLLLNANLDFTAKPTHSILVEAEDGFGGTITAAFIIQVVEVQSTNILDIDKLFTIKTYPNPSNGVFSIEFDKSGNADITVSIFDITGRAILTLNPNGNDRVIPVNITGSKPGVYVLNIRIDNYLHSQTIVVE